jgi:hypothetical protein
MTIKLPLLLRSVGAALHLIILFWSALIASIAGTEILYADGQLTKAGALATLAIAIHFAGVLGFALYRHTTLWRVTLLLIELVAFASSCIWLSTDLALVAGITLTAAIVLMLHKVKSRP